MRIDYCMEVAGENVDISLSSIFSLVYPCYCVSRSIRKKGAEICASEVMKHLVIDKKNVQYYKNLLSPFMKFDGAVDIM